MRALFLYNKADLYAAIPGGVQLCSKAFLDIVAALAGEPVMYPVPPSRSLLSRLLYRMNLNNYTGYRTQKESSRLYELISSRKITHVFINKSELMRFSKAIKQMPLQHPPMIILMSHGNESGDLLAELSGTAPRYRRFLRYTGILKLGLTLYTESFFRRRYIDMVCSMSEEECAIERWLGMNEPFFIPGTIEQDLSRPPLTQNPAAEESIFGYVGTLNHEPNIRALQQLFSIIEQRQVNFSIQIAGKPETVGKALESRYSFVRYLGVLPDEALNEEMRSWSFFINPIFHYSRGASMKLASAIAREIPVITTRAGRRGYLWSEGSLIETNDSPEAFAAQMEQCALTNYDYQKALAEVRLVKTHSLSTAAIAQQLKEALALTNTKK